MNDIVIEVKNATVRFNKSAESISGLKEYIIKMLKRELMFQEFLALKNINFTVKRGESWGLIGKNGSGKSTLLKLISGIIRPYQGNVTVNGSISPLIELGAGFDPELTARENIFLNGALLGYSKRFIESHFQEIVDFAELNDFAFQQKCKERMEHLLSNGTTLLFVSHSIEQVKELCSKAIWIDNGEVRAIGETHSVSQEYISSMVNN